jgi:hypothetical protein
VREVISHAIALLGTKTQPQVAQRTSVPLCQHLAGPGGLPKKKQTGAIGGTGLGLGWRP